MSRILTSTFTVSTEAKPTSAFDSVGQSTSHCTSESTGKPVVNCAVDCVGKCIVNWITNCIAHCMDHRSQHFTAKCSRNCSRHCTSKRSRHCSVQCSTQFTVHCMLQCSLHCSCEGYGGGGLGVAPPMAELWSTDGLPLHIDVRRPLDCGSKAAAFTGECRKHKERDRAHTSGFWDRHRNSAEPDAERVAIKSRCRSEHPNRDRAIQGPSEFSGGRRLDLTSEWPDETGTEGAPEWTTERRGRPVIEGVTEHAIRGGTRPGAERAADCTIERHVRPRTQRGAEMRAKSLID
jgi:hypothetical protein